MGCRTIGDYHLFIRGKLEYRSGDMAINELNWDSQGSGSGNRSQIHC
jgi:hypothetical protein